MKSNTFSICCGLILLLAGGLLLADGAGAFGPGHFIKGGGMILFGVAAAGFTGIYFLHGLRKWGWLFPALFCVSLFLAIGMDQAEVAGPFPAVPLFVGLALPFFAGFGVTRKRGLLLPGILLALFAAFLPISALDGGEWSGVALFGMLVAACLATYFLLTHPWWLLLLAGGSASLGLVVTLATLVPRDDYPLLPGSHFQLGFYTWVLFLGLALTFVILWLLRKVHPTAWAIIPAIGLLVLTVLFWLLGGRFQEGWLAAALLVTGVMILLSSGWRSLKIRPGRG